MYKDKVTAIILAAGQGKRMNLPVAKQYIHINGRPAIYYSLKTFDDSKVDEIILVTVNGHVDYCWNSIIKQYGIKKVIKVMEGGEERYASVYRALESIDNTDYVLIHDGARPLISTEVIERIIKNVSESDACIVGMPVKDTIKVLDMDGFIQSTPDRSCLWAAQTPQAFKFLEIKSAYEQLLEENINTRQTFTDDAMVYEAYIKKPVRMIEGEYANIKLTTQEDIIIAEAYAVRLGII